MKSVARGVAIAALSAFAVPAAAAPYTFTLNNGGSNQPGPDVAGSPDPGNVRTYTADGNPLGGPTLKVSGWTKTNPTAPATPKIASAYVETYGSSGLGVTSKANGYTENPTDCCEHAVDNKNNMDFLVLQFSTNVELNKGYFTAWPLNSSPNSEDSDAEVFRIAALPTDGSNASDFFTPTVIGTLINVFGTDQAAPNQNLDVDGWRDISNTPSVLDNYYSSIWVVAAPRVPGTNGLDAFKLGGVVIDTKLNGAVPEPATWAMMIAGFGFVGASMRRKNRIGPAAA